MTTKENIIELAVPEEGTGERIDRFLAYSLETSLSRTYLQKLIKEGKLTVNGLTVKPNYCLRTDDQIILLIPEPDELDLKPYNMPLEILYEDDDLAVINKPAGLIVHPGAGEWDHTLVNVLLYHLKNLSSIGGTVRPGIVHRLDRETSGLMVVAKNDKAHIFLSEEFAGRRVNKIYQTITCGIPRESHALIDQPIGRHPQYRQKMTIIEGGRDARSEYWTEKSWQTLTGNFSHLKVAIYTGRTHQIRVHLASIGAPVVGDPVYSKSAAKFDVPYLLLASTTLEFTHPTSGERVSFSIDLPEHMKDFITKLDNAESRG